MKLSKLFFVASTAFIVPFLGFIFLLKSGLSAASLNNYFAHSLLLIVGCALAFYISYCAYKAYGKNQDFRVFVIALAFYIFGFGFFIHGITVPGFYVIDEAIFDFTEHFSLFFGSLIMLGLIMPLEGLSAWLFQNRKKIFWELALLSLLVFVVIPVGLPQYIRNVAHYIDFSVVVPTGLLLLISLFFLIGKYRETSSKLILYLIAGLAILINAAIIPLFYEEWDLLWWYFHFIFVSSFAVILLGLIISQRSRQSFETAFGKTPSYAKIGNQLAIFIIALSIIPLITTIYFIFTAFENNLNKQIVSDLTLVAESQEGNVFAYIESKRIRAVNFSSDGYIRDSVRDIMKNPETSAEITDQLNRHLRVNKMALDNTILGVNVIDLNGKIIASTDDAELGKDESNDAYFTDTMRLDYGKAIINDIERSHHFLASKQSLAISAPLTDKDTGEKIGVLINLYNTDELTDLITGRYQVKLNALSGLRGRDKTLDIYLVNKDNLMITESRFFGKDVILKQISATEPVSACHQSTPKEISGLWADYRGVPVYGAAMCLTNFNWTLLVEIDQSEVLQPLFTIRNNVIIAIIFVIAAIIILSIYLSKKMTKPLESLADATEKISRGDLNIQANTDSKNEIGVLAKSFNAMVKNLLEIRQYPENIIKSMQNSLLLISPDGQIKEVNPITLNLTGYESQELIGKPLSIVTDTDYNVFAQTEVIENKELRFKTKNGQEIPMSASSSLMKNNKGEVIGIVIVSNDMREYQVAQDRIKASEQQLRAANQQLDAGNQQLVAAQKNLQDKLLELERFNKIAVGRELKMIELKQDIADLKKRAGEE